MKGVATRYPRIDPGAARLVNLGGRINLCRERNQASKPLPEESEDLLALTAYVTLGQMNLACAHCRDRNWGRTLLHEKISQGHGTGWPAYRLEWQTFGSLERRLRACYSGLRAEMPPTMRASSSSWSFFSRGVRTG
jgi:sulfur-oxidizing protein SoxA